VAWKKSPPDVIATFEKARPLDPAVESRPMFGYPAFFVNGNMIAGTFQDKIVVRLGDDPAIPGAKTAEPFEPMPGRPMTGFYVVPASVVRSPAKLREWVGRAHAHAKALPAKAAKKKQRAPAKKAR
jgi:TfoX/Sxy family transcriptional regulator of competence genes